MGSANNGHRDQYLPISERDHFSVLEELAQPGGLILAALDDLAS